MSAVLAWVAASIVFLWGVSHVVPTRRVVVSFGDIGTDNRYVITMEWVAEAILFWFAAALVVSVTIAGVEEAASDLVYLMTAGALAVVGVWTMMTRARTEVVWFKLCPL